MIRTKTRPHSTVRLLAGGSLAALALAVSFAPSRALAQAQPQPFGTMVGMQAGRTIGPNGQVSVWTGADRPTTGTDSDGRPLMTIQQTQQKALLDWDDFRLQTNEVLEFRQQASNWIAVNRVHGNQAAEVNGEIRAAGSVYIFDDNGVLIGKDAKINTRTLVTGRGFSDVNVDGNTTTIVQSSEKGLLDWSNMDVQAGQVLKFQQEKSSWVALNRSYNPDTTKIAGDIKADGNILLVAPRGISADGRIDAQQVVLSSLFMRDDQFFGSPAGGVGLGSPGGLVSYARDFNERLDPSFSNSWVYPGGASGYNPLGMSQGIDANNYYDLLGEQYQATDPNDPLKYNVTIGRTGVINAGAFGKVMLFGPNVTNKGIINVQDEGQVILAAGENIYLEAGSNGRLEAFSGAYNPFTGMRLNLHFPPQQVTDEKWRAFYKALLGVDYAVGDYVPYELYQFMLYGGYNPDGTYNPGRYILNYFDQLQYDRAHAIGYAARNEGIITAKRGGSVDFRGLNLEQMGAVDITSTALFRGSISFNAFLYDRREYLNGGSPGWDTALKGNGTVVFGKGSLTQITPDLDSTDMIVVSSGAQSVGSLTIQANGVDMQRDSLIYMPSGQMNVLLDAGQYVFQFGMNHGPATNLGNEDGTRFLMDAGATIDLSGWQTTLDMGYQQVTGKLFAAQLADSPVQRDGPLYRKEISVDRRFGTNLADWESFDNLSQGTLAQFLTNGGTLHMEIGDDFIMKSGSVIDVSGGVTTYRDGFVYTTLLRRLDGSVIDIREADPDEIYMGLANEWVVYDTKWGRQESYYIPLVSSVQGKYETSYQQGGNGGKIELLAPDAVLQGTLKGETVAGRYQRSNIPQGGSFVLNETGDTEREYVSNNVLITATEKLLDAQFGMTDKLSDEYGDLFGVEFDRDKDPVNSDVLHVDNTTLASADFFNRSTMGSYSLYQFDNALTPREDTTARVESGAYLNLANGASFAFDAAGRMEFLGSIRTEGGDVSLKGGVGLRLGTDTRIDTRGSWYSDYEVLEPIALDSVPRINGGDITLLAGGSTYEIPGVGLVLPETAVLDSSGGAWVTRDGVLNAGKGGDLNLTFNISHDSDLLDLGALGHARAYGLGGNGKFSLVTSSSIVIGDALPVVDDGPADPKTTMLIRPDFFEQSGFSSISLLSPNVTLLEGVEVHASSAVLQLIDQTLYNGRPPAYWAKSGTDIYDVAGVVDLPIEQKPAALRRGMDIGFLGTSYIEEGSLLATQPGGNITLGNAYVAGTLLAPSGLIQLGAGGGGEPGGEVHIYGTGRLLAPGSSLVTWHGLDSQGRELVDGEIHDGGTILIGAGKITLDRGAVLDVSGVSATFDLQTDDGRGGTIRQPVTLASNGGGISIDGTQLSIDDATYLAKAGGAGARGGAFVLNWLSRFGGGGGDPGGSPSYPNNGAMIDDLENYFQQGFFFDKQGNLLPHFYGTDLSQVDWSLFGIDFAFAPGTIYHDRNDLVGLLDKLLSVAKGIPPMLLIGNADDISITPPVAPEIPAGTIDMLNWLFQYTPPTMSVSEPVVTKLSPERIGQGGFSSLTVNASPGVIFSGNVNLGGKRADGSFLFDAININATHFFGREGANVLLEAGVVTLNNPISSSSDEGYALALEDYGVHAVGTDAHFTARAGTLLQVGSADLVGFGDVGLISGGDIRLAGFAPIETMGPPVGTLHATGLLTMKADQIYAGTGRIYTVASDTGIRILAQDDGGPINGSPYEAAAQLTIRAPRIEQDGTVRSPLGTINLEAYDNGTEGSGQLILGTGSLTSVSADGRMIPYGYTSNGDTWVDPFSGLELSRLPTKTINLTGGTVDLQQGAVLDVSGGGDLYAREFVPGVGGTKDWLTGYRDQDYDWVEAPEQIYAVLPGYDGNIAPLGFGASQIGIGDRVYLSGGSGLPAGNYVLLPAEYALLPGAFRVTLDHRYGDFTDTPLGKVMNLTDGSSVQSGYRIDGASGARDQRNQGFQVMPGATLRMRSTYVETTANTFFGSDAYLRKSLRINRPVADIPRIPIDGGSVVFKVGSSLNLDGMLKSEAGEGGRGGFADIASSKVVVAGADTDLGQYDGYLVLQSDQLDSFGASSLLIGGVRRQGDLNLELAVSGTDIVIDNRGSILYGPELLFASTGTIDVKGGAQIETRGTIAGSSGDLRIVPATPAFTAGANTPFDPSDDILVNGALDKGAVLRVSSGEQVDILRNGDAVSAMTALQGDPGALAQINAQRAANGLTPIDPFGGTLTIADGASIKSSRSVALDATSDTFLNAGATLQTRQLSAAASRVSIGAVPGAVGGLVFADDALGTLGNAEDLTLKSYSSIDLYGPVSLRADDALRLDAREIRVIGADGDEAKISARTLTLANSSGGTANAVRGNATLTLDAANLYFEGQDKWLSGVDRVNLVAQERVIGRDDSTLFVPGALDIASGGITAESSARLFLDAAGDIAVHYNGNTGLPVFQSFGGTLGLVGASIDYAGKTRITGGTIALEARSGDVTLADGAVLDVTSNVSRFYDESVGVGAGNISLIADRGDVVAGAGSTIDVSGSAAGGNAGTLTIQTGLGDARLEGTLRGTAADGYRSGSFSLLTHSLADFAGFNARLDAGGFTESRRFEINSGDVTINGSLDVQNLAIVTNDGAIDVTGTVATTGADGGRIQLSAAKGVTLESTARLLARARAVDGAGGAVLLETTGQDGGVVSTEAGSLIDVSGTGEGGRLVRFRAPQLGDDIGIGHLSGTITGARAILAEGYRVYDEVSVIDQPLIDRVEGDARVFMDANAAAIRDRLGAGVTLTAGIELRSSGDMALETDWDLSGVRFDGAPGVLTLRAAGDLRLDADLTDGFAGDRLMDGESWTYNLTAGANVASPDSMAVLAQGLLEPDRGSVIVGGTPDTVEYYYDPAYGNENRLYLLGPDGNFLTDFSSISGYVELVRDPETGKYVDPRTGAAIEKDPATGDYADTGYYARRPLPWLADPYSFSGQYQANGTSGGLAFNGLGETGSDLRQFQQWDNSTGHVVRTGTGAINIAAGRDLVLQERPSVIYTAGRNAPAVTGFYVPDTAQYGTGGGDLTLAVAGDILANPRSPQLPQGYLEQRGLLDESGRFLQTEDRLLDQTTWWINYDRFAGGIGALGGGDIDISVGGDVRNLSVSIPNSGRTVGDPQQVNGLALTTTGGGDLSLRVGGNLLGGVYYVAEGMGDLTVGGSILSGSRVYSGPRGNCHGACITDIVDNKNYDALASGWDLYTLFFTSSGRFDIKAGGDVNIDGVLDPLMDYGYPAKNMGYISLTPDASARIFSAGGDVTLWTNEFNTSLAYFQSGPSQYSPSAEPTWFQGAVGGFNSIAWDLYPSKLDLIAATGNVRLLGGITMLPAADGELNLLAGSNVFLGYGTQAIDPFLGTSTLGAEAQNYRGAYEGVYMSQASMDHIRTPTNQAGLSPIFSRVMLWNAGWEALGNALSFTLDNPPDLHVGDTNPVRIYAAGGDVVTSGNAALSIPKQLWVQAEGNIYFPSYAIQHNNPNDLSLVRAGKGIYFDIAHFVNVSDALPPINYGNITIAGPGRLEVEAGTDIWLPSNNLGIYGRRIQVYAADIAPGRVASGLQDWHPDEKAADIAISTGFNQAPSYAAFELAYLDPDNAGGMADYLIDEETGKSLYLFDRDYPRAATAKGAFATPEPREGLVNYVRRLQGLAPLATKAEQLAYLDTAWSYWEALPTDYKTPYYRSVLFLELRTTGREANDPSSERAETSKRGYDAIATLFPGAEKASDEALGEGESRWQGNFETYASRVVSEGGGKVEFVMPGGGMILANAAAQPGDTGQPAYPGDHGNALRAGILTTDGGEINIMGHDSITVNESRILTSKGGNVLIWSSWGDIAAGKGAKTSISPQFYNYALDGFGRLDREPAGLPTGAGIGTLATQPGTPPADVDLVAPAGIVDAGDAGIRVSGNFNVYAIEILGTDNIDVAGVATGLPVPPATPPNSLDAGEAGTKSAGITKTLEDAVKRVRDNAGIVLPSIIEVRVVDYGASTNECGSHEKPCAGSSRAMRASAPVQAPGTIAPTQIAMQQDAPRTLAFDLAPQSLDDAVRAVGRTSGVNILYDATILKSARTAPLRGNMTPEQALARLLSGQDLVPVRIGPRTIMLRRRNI